MDLPRTAYDYLDDLEIDPDSPDSDLEFDEYDMPRFKCRFRVGRGGRVMMDRIPVGSHLLGGRRSPSGTRSVIDAKSEWGCLFDYGVVIVIVY